MVDENDRVVTPAAPEVEPAPRYVWMATHTAAKDAIIYRRAIAEDPHAVPLRVWQFCEENGVDVCVFDGVQARGVTELEEVLALSPPHAHGQIRGDGAIFNAPPVADEIAPPPDYPPPEPVPPIAIPVVEPRHEPVEDAPDQEHSSGE